MVTYAAIFLTFAVLLTCVAVILGVLVAWGNAMRSSPGPMEGGSLFVVPFIAAVVFWCLWAAQ